MMIDELQRIFVLEDLKKREPRHSIEEKAVDVHMTPAADTQ